MADPAYKKIEIVGTSSESFSAATANAVAEASKTLHNIRWFEVVEQRGRVADGAVAEYQTTIRVGFRLD